MGFLLISSWSFKSSEFCWLRLIMEVLLSALCQIICVCLTGSAVSLTDALNSSYGPSDVTLLGPDVATVGIPVSYACVSLCSPACSYSITAGDRRAGDQELTFILRERVTALSITCTAHNNVTGLTASKNKTLRVMQGPENVSISGLASLPVGRTQRFLCSSVCWPSCNYTWSSDGVQLSASGNEVRLTPSAGVVMETLVCTATNSVTGLFASAVLKLLVTDGPSHTIIRGPDAMEGDSSGTFECLTVCKPTCNFTWTVEDQSAEGKMIRVTVPAGRDAVKLSCRAQNSITRATAEAQKTVRVTGNSSAPVTLNLVSVLLAALTLHFTPAAV